MTATATEHDLFGDAVRPKRSAMGSHQKNSGGSDEWLTPPRIVSALGAFDLDPCSPINRPWDTARRHLTIADDGLTQPWAGRVWLNPPYAHAGKWLARLADHGQGTALVFARTETRIWHEQVWPKASGLLFLRGRITFYHLNGQESEANSGAPSVLIAYGRSDANMLASLPLPGYYVELGRG